MEASKTGPRCGVCRRTELEGEQFVQCSYCQRLFCPSHIAIHELGCQSRPKAKRAMPDISFSVSAGRKAAAVLVTVLIIGSFFGFVTYPGATQALEGAIGNAANYLSSYVGGQVQGSNPGNQNAVAATNASQSVTTTSSASSQSTTSQTSNQVAPPLTIDAQWVSAFISAVNSHRSANLTENSALDQFAGVRFNTLTTNYQITHYGLQQDVSSFFSGVTIRVAEEYFFPNLPAAAYAQLIQSSFGAHWQDLVDSSYVHFGYYVGSGPAISRIGACSAPLENVGSINETQLLIQNNCRFSVLPATYVVIELGD